MRAKITLPPLRLQAELAIRTGREKPKTRQKSGARGRLLTLSCAMVNWIS